MKLADYLELVVEPTFADFSHNPLSGRHAFLACVAAFHSIDHATHPRKPSNLRREWRQQSFEFMVIDMVAHHFKHVQCDAEKQPLPKDAIPISDAIFGYEYGGREAMGLDLHNLYFVVRDGIKFIRSQVERMS